MVADLADEVAARLRYCAEVTRMTHDEIARAVSHVTKSDVSRQAVTKWLKTGQVKRENLVAFCQITRFNFDWLLTGQGPPRPPMGGGGVDQEKLDSMSAMLLDLFLSLSRTRQEDTVAMLQALVDREAQDRRGRDQQRIVIDKTPGRATGRSPMKARQQKRKSGVRS